MAAADPYTEQWIKLPFSMYLTSLNIKYTHHKDVTLWHIKDFTEESDKSYNTTWLRLTETHIKQSAAVMETSVIEVLNSKFH
jgi:hypothetical protein